MPGRLGLALALSASVLASGPAPGAAQPSGGAETAHVAQLLGATSALVGPRRVMVTPIAARQLQEGYWLGGIMGPQDVQRLKAVGIKIVISAASPLPGTVEALRAAGIQHRSYVMGKRFKHAEEILDIASEFKADEIFIHCKHGADRTGCVAAFLLVVKHGWKPSDALYAVVYPTAQDTEGLARVLHRHGMHDEREVSDPRVGFYSVSSNGHATGGLKVRNAGYENLVSTAIKSMVKHGKSTARVAR